MDALQTPLGEVKGDTSSVKQRVAQSDREIAAACDQMAATVGAAAVNAWKKAAIRHLEQTARRIEATIKGEEGMERVQQQPADAASDARQPTEDE